MVSLNSILTLGGLGAAALIYLKYGGLSGIGQAIGGSIGGFGQGITQGLNQFGNLVTTPESNAPNTAARVVEQENLGAYVTNIPNAPVGEVGLTPQQKMEMQIKIAEVVSSNVAKAPTPQVVMLGGGDSGSPAGEAMKVFGAERAIELIKKVNEGIK